MSVNIYNSNPNATSEEENFSCVADRGSKLASDTIYSNTTSGLNSVNVQGAIDEVNEKVEDNVEAISQINSDLTDSNAHLPIYGTTKGQGRIQDALNVDLTNVDGSVNRVGYVYSGYTGSLPSDCSHGIREVFYYNSVSVLIKITGVDTNNKYAEWGNVYNGTDWTGWVRL